MKIKYLLSALFVIIFILSASISCGKISASPAFPSNGGSVILTLYDCVDNFALTNKIVSTYNKQRGGIIIKVRYLPNEGYDDTVDRLFETGNFTSDICFVRQPGQVNRLAAKGQLTDLAAINAKSIESAKYGSTISIVSDDNHIYALPRIRSSWVLFYNKTILAEYGLANLGEMTWADYEQLTLKLTNYGVGSGKVYGGYIPPWTLNLGAVATDEYLTDDDLSVTKAYLDMLRRLYNLSDSHPSIPQMEELYSNSYALFARDKLATMINGDWSIGMLNQQFYATGAYVDYAIAPLPTFSGDSASICVAACSYLAIAKDCAYPDEALDFLTYYCGEPGAKIMAAASICPAYYSADIQEIFAENTQIDGTQYLFNERMLNEELKHSKYNALKTIFNREMMPLLRDEITVEEAFERFYEQRRALFAP